MTSENLRYFKIYVVSSYVISRYYCTNLNSGINKLIIYLSPACKKKINIFSMFAQIQLETEMKIARYHKYGVHEVCFMFNFSSLELDTVFVGL